MDHWFVCANRWIPEKWRLLLGLASIASDPYVTQYA
jgi:hypothetical protein